MDKTGVGEVNCTWLCKSGDVVVVPGEVREREIKGYSEWKRTIFVVDICIG